MIDIQIYTPTIRLKDALKFSGAVYNGADAKNFIKEKQIKVNGEFCAIPGKQLVDGDTFEFEGEIYRVINR